MFLGKKPELWTPLRSRWRSRWSHGAQPGQQMKCGLKTLGVRKRRMVKPTAMPAVLRVLRGGGDGVMAFRAPGASPREEVGQIWPEANGRRWPVCRTSTGGPRCTERGKCLAERDARMD